jgi:hypothetical protein
MARSSWVFDRDLQKLVPRDEFYARQPAPKVSDTIPRPYFISDNLGGINGLRNHADGRDYDSKSEYYRAVKRAGCEVVGNESLSRPATKVETPAGLKEDLHRAWSQHS